MYIEESHRGLEKFAPKLFNSARVKWKQILEKRGKEIRQTYLPSFISLASYSFSFFPLFPRLYARRIGLEVLATSAARHTPNRAALFDSRNYSVGERPFILYIERQFKKLWWFFQRVSPIRSWTWRYLWTCAYVCALYIDISIDDDVLTRCFVEHNRVTFSFGLLPVYRVCTNLPQRRLERQFEPSFPLFPNDPNNHRWIEEGSIFEDLTLSCFLDIDHNDFQLVAAITYALRTETSKPEEKCIVIVTFWWSVCSGWDENISRFFIVTFVQRKNN